MSNKDHVRNKEQYIFFLKTAYQIPDNLTHLT